MIIEPTKTDLIEFDDLYNEFKDAKESAKLDTLKECLGMTEILVNVVRDIRRNKEEATFPDIVKLYKYNRYLELRVKFAPFFYSKLECDDRA